MKNIQKQYTDLLEGKMSKQNFMRNVRMEFPQHISPVSSFEDSIKILKGKRIISEAAKPEGVYGHNPNAETPPAPGIDQLNYYQVYHGIQYELAQMPEITDENYIKARKKVVDTILKDPDAYKQLQLANFKAVKAMDEDLKMKEVKENNLTDKPNEMKVVKKDAKANTEDTLEKKEKKKAKDAGIKQMTQTPKKAKGISKVMEVPGKEKSLNESLRGINEALNKDIKAFGQDLDKRFKEAGFDTLVTMQTATPQQLDIVKTNPKAALFEVSQTPETQMLILHVNPKMVTKAESIINKFQFSDYNGPILKKGWTAKQVQGAINPGDIYKQDNDKSKGLWYFYRLAKVNTTVKTQSTSTIQPNQTNLREAVKALKESILREFDHKQDVPETFSKGQRVMTRDKKKVGEIAEVEQDTATVKLDDGDLEHIQLNILTGRDVPAKEEKVEEAVLSKDQTTQMGSGYPTKEEWDSMSHADKVARLKNSAAAKYKDVQIRANDDYETLRKYNPGVLQAMAFPKSPLTVDDDAPAKDFPIKGDHSGLRATDSKFKSLKEKITQAFKEVIFRDKKTGKAQSIAPTDPLMKDPQFNQVFTKA